MKALAELRHLHLSGFQSYLRLAALQDHLVRVYLDHKAAPKVTTAPAPTLLTFETTPTYTCGRREIGKLSEAQVAYLKAGGKAEFHEALRGGQLTWHGPGQLTAYIIVSLKEHGLDTRKYITLLENSVVATCKQFALTTHTTENPGVWIGTRNDDRKIASVGVHLRRNIASHGIGLNVSVDLSWFDRIVACGLVGKQATSIEKELKALYQSSESRESINPDDSQQPLSTVRPDGVGYVAESMTLPLSVERVAQVFANNVAVGLSGAKSTPRSVAEEEIFS